MCLTTAADFLGLTAALTYDTRQNLTLFRRQMLERLAAFPGVRSADPTVTSSPRMLPPPLLRLISLVLLGATVLASYLPAHRQDSRTYDRIAL